MTFEEWWAHYWADPVRKNWLDTHYEDVARAAYDSGRLEVISQMSQKDLIKYLDTKYGNAD